MRNAHRVPLRSWLRDVTTIVLLTLASIMPATAGLEISIGNFFPPEAEARTAGRIAPMDNRGFDYWFDTIGGERFKFTWPRKWSRDVLEKIDAKRVYVRGTFAKNNPRPCWLLLKELRAAAPEELQPPTLVPSQRPAALVARTEATWTISGVRWGLATRPTTPSTRAPELEAYRFVNTKIDANRVTGAYLGVQTIPPVLRHAFLLFTFAPGGCRADTTESSGLVVSIEPLRDPRRPKPLVEMLRGELPIVYQLGAWEDFTVYNCERWRQKMSLWPLRLAHGQVTPRKWLETMLTEATAPRLAERYDMNRNNCSGSIAAALHEILVDEAAEKLRKEFRGPLIITNPRRLPGVLAKIGLLDESAEVVVTPDNYFVPLAQLMKKHP